MDCKKPFLLDENENMYLIIEKSISNEGTQLVMTPPVDPVVLPRVSHLNSSAGVGLSTNGYSGQPVFSRVISLWHSKYSHFIAVIFYRKRRYGQNGILYTLFTVYRQQPKELAIS